jgi:hypothetical protein
METENDNQNENLVTQLFYNDDILEAGLSIIRDRKRGNYCVSTSLYNKNPSAYDKYKCLLIEDNDITSYEMNIIHSSIFRDEEYNKMRILKTVYEEHKAEFDSIGVKILIEIERNYIFIPSYDNRQYQLAKVMQVMTRP